MSPTNPWAVRAAEAYEKAAKQSLERGDRAKGAEQWESAANLYIQERVFDRAIACLDSAGLIPARTIELFEAFEAEKVLEVLRTRRLQREEALGLLHLQSRGSALGATAAFEASDSAARAPGVDDGQSLQFLKAGMLAASWLKDESRVVRAADLALARLGAAGRGEGKRASRGRIPTDATLFLLCKIAASGEFALVNELHQQAFQQSGERVSQNPFEPRLLVPIYLYRGIKLATLLDAFRSIRGLQRYAELYGALFAGIETGEADAALERFIIVVGEHADKPDPSAPVKTWEDVERRFAQVIYAQPEALAASILWDQIGATRAGLQEVRELVAEARESTSSHKWARAIEVVEQVAGNPVLQHLPKEVQVQIYQLGCLAAFQAEDWPRYDRWAALLEEQYQVKDVLHQVVVAGQSSRGRE